jgi:hypothetical protein
MCEFIDKWMNRIMFVGGAFAVCAFVYIQAPKVIESPAALGIVGVLGVLAVCLALQKDDFV